MWIFENYYEPTFGLLGFVVGFFYGFDGWQGSPEKLSFSNSPRARNLLFVTGTLLTTFVSTLIVSGDNFSRARLVFFYICGFLFGATIVVGGWGIIILMKYGYLKVSSPEKYPPPPFSPFSDYFFYGYRFVREEYSKGIMALEEIQRQRQHDFLPTYGRQISQSIAAASSYQANPSESKRSEITKHLLSSICAVMYLYNSNKKGLWFNANYMVAYPADRAPEEVRKSVRFAWGDTNRYEYYLQLYTYADPKGAMTFALPVERRNSHRVDDLILPGAPEAFINNETLVVDNIKDIAFPAGVPDQVRTEITTYFKRRKTFQSFACLNVVFGGRQVGIVNVEANTRNIFGKNQQHKDELEALLFPFCFLLGFLFTDLS